MENINISSRRHFSTLGFIIRAGRERANASKYVQRLGVKTPSLYQLIMHLSGGNQQKVILARWLCEKIHTILLDEPTRGIDVGAKSEIYSIIYQLAEKGIAVVVVSSELPEVLGISDRILVMRQGQIVADLPRGEATPEPRAQSRFACRYRNGFRKLKIQMQPQRHRDTEANLICRSSCHIHHSKKCFFITLDMPSRAGIPSAPLCSLCLCG